MDSNKKKEEREVKPRPHGFLLF